VISLQDYELDRTGESPIVVLPPPKHSRRTTTISIVIALVLGIGAGAGVWYYAYRTSPSQPAATPTVARPAIAQPPVTRPLAPAAVTLPPLPETDALMRELVGALSSHPTVAAWLATNGLISNFTVVTLNISEGKAPATHLRALAPRGRFLTGGSAGSLYLDPRSYERYNGYAEAVAALDATGTARLYLTVKPRILDAYRELGSPDGDFDPVLQRAIGELLKVPVVEGNIPLQRRVVSFAFADPRLESLSPVQRQFLRMGPRNVEAVQAKLREIAGLLNLHPEAVAAR
jgi:hypothetical protein